MATSTTRRTGFTDEQLVELMPLLEGSDTVELKLTVPEASQATAIETLGMDPLDAQIRQVFFFDTPDLALNKKGLVVRARRIQGKGGDAVVKLRPVVPHELSPKLRAMTGFGVEVDAMPGGFVCSGRLKVPVDPANVRLAAKGELPIRKLFSKEQRRLYADNAPEGVALDDLSVLGPIFVLKLAFTPEGIQRRLVAEMWMYPDGSRLLELSTKCLPTEAFQVSAVGRAFLTSRGIDLSGEQETKTRKALTFFSRRLREATA
jgi:hypothetical protein